MVDGIFDGSKPGQCFAFTESSVHQESGALGLQQGDVAGASGSQDGNAKADRIPPRNRKTNFRMMAERVNRVNGEEKVFNTEDAESTEKYIAGKNLNRTSDCGRG